MPKSLTPTDTHQLLHIPSSSTHKRAAICVAIFLFIVSMLILPFGERMLPEVKPFLPAFIAWFLFGDFMTAYLLYSQFRAARSMSLLVLSCTYLYTALITLPHILTFPGVFSDTGLIGAGDQSAVWLWVLWHGGFPAGIMLYVWTSWKTSAPLKPRGLGRKGAAAIMVVLGIVLGAYLLVTLGNDVLPRIIQKGNFRALLDSGIGPVVWMLNMLALVLLLVVHRGRSVLHLWLTVAVFVFLLDVTLTLFSGARYSLGWYAARTNSLISATVVICSLMYEVNKLYIRMVKNREQLLSSRQRLEEANEQLTRLSEMDGLTEIPNRRAFDDKLSEAMKSSAAGSYPAALLLVDVDYFKAYNDHYGHLGGDAVLKEVAAALEQTASASSLASAYRYGGEEFAVIMKEAGPEEAAALGEQIREAVARLQISHEHSQVSPHVSVSIGVHSRIVRDGETGQQLVDQADRALYRAKEAGRNRVEING
ncbi:MASE4 domain-containing protein [Paenibacillus lemnae]|uniref:Diguanylate cyclase n=1 Tax=Paenibacillus lemnae TaxID=1330551 RepID=A0A848M5D3_PAELE|nr:MASE4 domain-containing protein [Paenibacillus lemnae]NMO96328.1 diguanylate cyclase [Paenibacillus lemnae]